MTDRKKYQKDWHKNNPKYSVTYKKKWAKENPEKYLLYNPRQRAKKSGLEFNLQPEDVKIPNHCPVLGVKLTDPATNSKENTYGPSLHRIDSSKGYVKGNVMVVSWRANTLLSDSSAQEIRCLYEFSKRYMNDE